MPDTFLYARTLTPVDYSDNLIIVVSDPSIPLDDPDLASKRISASQLLSATHDWDPLSAFTLDGVKTSDYLKVVNQPAYILLGNRTVKNGDMFLVVNLSPLTLFLLPTTSTPRHTIHWVSAAESPFTATINSDIYADVTDGPVTIALPTVHGENDCINIIPDAGRYELNALTITAIDNMAGATDAVEVTQDGLLIQARWVGGSVGYTFISR